MPLAAWTAAAALVSLVAAAEALAAAFVSLVDALVCW